MTSADSAKKFASLIKRLRSRFPGPPLTPVDQIVPPPSGPRAAADEATPRPGSASDDAAGLAAVADLAIELGEDGEDGELDGPQEAPASAARPSAKSKTPAVAKIEVGVDSSTRELLFSFLLWDSTTQQAINALKRLEEIFVDYNELRVSLADEIVAMLGVKYPFAAERAARIRAALTDVFKREHSLRLAHLAQLGKREASAYLRSLEGAPPYVASRVAALCLDAHAIPVDHRLLALLRLEKIVAPDDDVTAAESILAHLVPASEGLDVAAILQRWSDEEGSTPRRAGILADDAPAGPEASPARRSAAESAKASKPAAAKKSKSAKPDAGAARTAKSRDKAANPSKPRNSG